MKNPSNILAAAIALLAPIFIATAQDKPPGPPSPGERGNRGGFNMEDFKKRMNDMLKDSLKATDDEWAILQPLIEKVQTKQREGMTSQFAGMIGNLFGGRGPGGPGGGGGFGGDRGGSPESQALRTALENTSASPEDLKAKLTALREARKKSADEMEATRAELRKVVSVRQEAVLVSMGILE